MAMTPSKVELRRVNINLPVDLIEKVKDYAESMGINYTTAYIVLINQALQYQDTVESLPLIIQSIKALNNKDNTEE